MYSRDVATRFRFGRGDAGAVVADSDRQTLTALQSTIVKNRNLKVLAIQGLYDLATPYMSVKYTLDHMPLPPDYAANVELLVVPAGHMAYDDARALREMNDATVRFIDASALGTR
jgi:carboxypeptidase C (cathepsin A)